MTTLDDVNRADALTGYPLVESAVLRGSKQAVLQNGTVHVSPAMMALIRGAAGLDIVGGDVVEVAPAYDPTTATAQIGAQMLFEIVSVVAMAVARRSTE